MLWIKEKQKHNLELNRLSALLVVHCRFRGIPLCGSENRNSIPLPAQQQANTPGMESKSIIKY